MPGSFVKNPPTITQQVLDPSNVLPHPLGSTEKGVRGGGLVLILQTGKLRPTEEECCLALILVRSVAEPADAPPFYTNSL